MSLAFTKITLTMYYLVLKTICPAVLQLFNNTRIEVVADILYSFFFSFYWASNSMLLPVWEENSLTETQVVTTIPSFTINTVLMF